MKWKDISSYSRGDKDRIPKAFQAEVKDIKLVVTRHIRHDPDVWVLACAPWFDGYELCKGAPVEEAQTKAIELVSDKLQMILKTLK